MFTYFTSPIVILLATVLVWSCGGKKKSDSKEEAPPAEPVISAQQPDNTDGGSNTDSNSTTAKAEILTRRPVVVSEGTTVVLTGRNFSSGITLALSTGTAVPIRVQSDTAATFVVPDVNTYGQLNLTATSGSSTQNISLFFTATRTDHPIITAPASSICTGTQFYDIDGALTTGTKNCTLTPPADCASDGEVGCLTTASFKAAALTGLAAKVITGTTVAGVSGTATGSYSSCASDGAVGCITTSTFKAANVSGLAAKVVSGNTVASVAGTATAEAHSNCASDGATGCVATSSYKAAAITGLAAKVVSGQTVAGVSGSATAESHANCAADGATGCVAVAAYTAAATASLAAKIVSGNTVAGVAGSATAESHSDCAADGATGCVAVAGYPAAKVHASNLAAANIKSGVVVGGVTGSYSVPVLNLWDVRAGVDRGDGQRGRLKVKCRNASDPALYNYDGAIGSIGDTGVTSGTTFDVWDTIDDFAALPWTGYLPIAWSNDEAYCGNIELALNDENVWRDVTTGGCNATACRYKDKITNVEWSKTIGSGRTWPQALNDCDALTHDGYSDWRLPTQKELMDAYVHGIRSVATANWITDSDMTASNFWSSTSISFATDNAWLVNFSHGYQNAAGNKNSPLLVTCVREDIRGHFLVGTDGYFAKSNNHYCHITTMQMWADLGGPADANSAPKLNAVPSYLTDDGACTL